MTTHAVRRLGVEEEFQLIDLGTRRLTPRAPELLAMLPGHYVEELQRCVVETNSGVTGALDELQADLADRRRVLVDTAESIGVGVVAAGSVPLVLPSEISVSSTPRYRQMLQDYQLLAREQLICGTQFHVDVRDRDEAIAIGNQLTGHLPTLLAISASSPFWATGEDTGYASARTLVWSRWPTTGLSAPVETAAEYDELLADLVAAGVIVDESMVYYDLRASRHISTLELRICDSIPSLEAVTLVAGLFRGLVAHAAEELASDSARPRPNQTVLRAARWRAARSGLEGDLVDLTGDRPMARPAGEVVRALVDLVTPQLEKTGDLELVTHLVETVLQEGSSAFRQRQTLTRTGSLEEVVDELMAATAGRRTRVETVTPGAVGYTPHPGAPCDEVVAPGGVVAGPYRPVVDALTALGSAELRTRQFRAERAAIFEGLVFGTRENNVTQAFRTDIVPRIIEADAWAELARGLRQRALAINAFVDDAYGAREIIRDGVVPATVIDQAPGFRQTGVAQAPGAVRTHVIGFDVVATSPGQFLVLEDNIRVPSGIGYALAARKMLDTFFEDVPRPEGLRGTEDVLPMLRDTMRAAAPARCDGEPSLALVSDGPSDGAWFEHHRIGVEAGMALVSVIDLAVEDEILYRYDESGRHRVDVLYARVGEDTLLSGTGHDGAVLRTGILGAVRAGNLTVANSLGNGVGDDKAVYAFVPSMIDYYLGERPLTPQIPTYLCSDPEQCAEVLSRLDELVVKPTDGYGGAGVTIGGETSEVELQARREELIRRPGDFIAQEIVRLSTHPTFDGTRFKPHHVDLRAFVHLRNGPSGITALDVPCALTRVAAEGTLIVNSSRGGGGKDTWILG